VNTSEVQPKWCHACNSNTYVPEHRLHQKKKMEFLCQRKKSSAILPKHSKNCLYLLLGSVFLLTTFRTGEFVVTQSSKGKRKKQQEAVTLDIKLILYSNCCYHCLMISVAGSCVLLPLKKKSHRTSASQQCCPEWLSLGNFCFHWHS